MGILDGLKFVVAKRSSLDLPIVARRNKLLRKLFEQEELTKAEIGGGVYTASKLKKISDADGNTRVVEVPKRVQRWSYTGEDGKLCLVIKYGNRLIEFSKGKQAIEVGDLAGLLSTLEKVRTAVLAGELDSEIENVVTAVKNKRSK